MAVLGTMLALGGGWLWFRDSPLVAVHRGGGRCCRFGDRELWCQLTDLRSDSPSTRQKLLEVRRTLGDALFHMKQTACIAPVEMASEPLGSRNMVRAAADHLCERPSIVFAAAGNSERWSRQ